MTEAATGERGRRLRRQTAEVLHDASLLVRTGEHGKAVESLEDAAEETDCPVCEATLRGAAGGVAFATISVGAGDSDRITYVADEITRIATAIDPDTNGPE